VDITYIVLKGCHKHNTIVGNKPPCRSDMTIFLPVEKCAARRDWEIPCFVTSCNWN